MRKRLLEVLGVVGVILAVIVLLKVAPAGSASPAQGLKTAWGDPDLQGIWTDDYQTPLQRPAKYANKSDSPTKSAPNSTGSARRSCGEISEWRSAPSATSPARTTRCSSRSSTRASERR